MTILIRKFIQIFLLKLSYKSSCVKFDAFTRRNGSFYPKKTEHCAAKVLGGRERLVKNLEIFGERNRIFGRPLENVVFESTD